MPRFASIGFTRLGVEYGKPLVLTLVTIFNFDDDFRRVDGALVTILGLRRLVCLRCVMGLVFPLGPLKKPTAGVNGFDGRRSGRTISREK